MTWWLTDENWYCCSLCSKTFRFKCKLLCQSGNIPMMFLSLGFNRNEKKKINHIQQKWAAREWIWVLNNEHSIKIIKRRNKTRRNNHIKNNQNKRRAQFSSHQIKIKPEKKIEKNCVCPVEWLFFFVDVDVWCFVFGVLFFFFLNF